MRATIYAFKVDQINKIELTGINKTICTDIDVYKNSYTHACIKQCCECREVLQTLTTMKLYTRYRDVIFCRPLLM